MSRYVSVVFACLLIGAGAAKPMAQSLAALAHQEEERRKAIKQPSKIISNKDLQAVPASTTPPPPVAPPKAGAGSAASDSKATDTDTDAKATGAVVAVVKDQAYWAGRLSDLQTQLDRDQSFTDALQVRINSLTTDFVNRDDPAQRALIEQSRQKSLEELNRLQAALQHDKKALADFQEEARRAGVPPGWLR